MSSKRLSQSRKYSILPFQDFHGGSTAYLGGATAYVGGATAYLGGATAYLFLLHNHATSWSNLQDCKISSKAEIPKLDRVWQ